MAQRMKGTIEKKNASKIIGIQFSILSPEEIRKGSVAEIKYRDGYVNNKPVMNGLFDPRMGVLEPGFICPTDGLDYIQTPGYFGHIELARPVFYIQYLDTVTKIARCVCLKCSKLLISKEKYKHILKLSAEDRWKFVFNLASKIKRCGEDISDGCGCKRPKKIKKESLATLVAEWDKDKDDVGAEGSEDSSKTISLYLTPEILLKCFKRISDEDVFFMGFSPIWSRPDWMICQVMAVPPPAMRPSVKHDAQQRSEDDVTHSIVHIIKANKTLQEKIQTNAPGNIINDWTTVLQYYVATLVDNKIPGVAAVAQKNGRPYKSIKERLNGKHGRVRGNLMGKRVDFSARSVITPDPNIGAEELGIPLKIAKNITKPILVNKLNKKFLEKLVQNGPDVHPGAKILEKKNGDNISLRYVDRTSIKLEIGDIVHRHMMNGDGILFNRQPTLHRMSMMCHIARIMPVGDTFRMNVCDTKPYNADFDGDEMNLHMPQDSESESELLNLAAVTWQIISPANNKSIIGIFQDSLLGSYRFTRENVNFTPRQAMNLLMGYNKVSIPKLENSLLKSGQGTISSFNILSQILPPMSLKYRTKKFDETKDDYNTSNAVLEIKNGEYIRGQMEKGVLADGSNGMLQRICNDFGNKESIRFIDSLQSIVTEYMKSSSFSVGISDLIADATTNEKIAEVIMKKKIEVKNLIDQIHLGIFENKTGKTDEEEFETQVNNILSRAVNDAGKTGRESLNKENRFVIMVNAGSKGADLNISQMISCLGQQNVEGKRIPYGFENRTLPHFTKYDDSPAARGFVENSFISGLTPEELFFHAMGGRIGIIDTAVKTSQTGYIQRRLIKGLEDLKVEYDMTVRNNKNKIIQYSYGDDGFDPVKVEFQSIPLTTMTLEEIYAHFQMPTDNSKDEVYTTSYTKETLKRISQQNKNGWLPTRCKQLIDYMIASRDRIIKNVFNNLDNKTVNVPVAFIHLINNVQNQHFISNKSMVDITPYEAYQLIDEGYVKISAFHYVPPTELFKVLYYYYLNPKDLLMVKRFNKKALLVLIDKIVLTYKRAIIAPGEMVGMIAAQSIGEPTTQMTLNTFHFAGIASKSNVTRGVPRIEEILELRENTKNPSCTIRLFANEEMDQENAKKIMNRIEYTQLSTVVDQVQICFDPNDANTLIKEDALLMKQFQAFENMVKGCDQAAESEEKGEDEEEEGKSKWIIRLKINAEELLDRNLTMDDIHFAIKKSYHNQVSCVFSDYNNDNLVFRIRLNIPALKKKSAKSKQPKVLDQSDEIYLLKGMQDNLLNNLILRGIKNIDKVTTRKIMNSLVADGGNYTKKETWVLDTVGTNLMDLLGLDYIDTNRTFTNDIQEIYRVFGIESARQAILNEITDVIEFDGTYINFHHISMLCDRMTCNDSMVSIFRHGINNDDIGPIAKASFEETPQMFMDAAQHAELDTMRGVSANVMCGQEGYFGTSAFQTLLDIDQIVQSGSAAAEEWGDDKDDETRIDDAFEELADKFSSACSLTNLEIRSNASHIAVINMGNANDDYNPGF
jgi:DNA-directed RNA polymerase II subunit RPB1